MYKVISLIAQWAVPLVLVVVPTVAWRRGVKVYETFLKGAEKGFETAIKTIPFLVGMLVAIGIFRASGAMELLLKGISPVLGKIGVPGEILPLAVMRPFSGGAALAITADLIKTYGPDSLVGRLASTMQGSSDTTFFILTLYFGSVGISRYRYALTAGLIADAAAFITAFIVVQTVFG